MPGWTPLVFEFKWIDNVDPSSGIMRFHVDGDVAPNGRFDYRYCEKREGDGGKEGTGR